MITVKDKGGLRWKERPDGHFCWAGNRECEITHGLKLAEVQEKYGPLTIVEVTR